MSYKAAPSSHPWRHWDSYSARVKLRHFLKAIDPDISHERTDSSPTSKQYKTLVDRIPGQEEETPFEELIDPNGQL